VANCSGPCCNDEKVTTLLLNDDLIILVFVLDVTSPVTPSKSHFLFMHNLFAV